MPVVQTKGSASSQGFGEFAQQGGAVNWIDDVFSTYLYTGNGTSQTITNGIDLAGEGGLTWIKRRTAGTPFESHQLYDTLRGVGQSIYSNDTAAQGFYADSLTAFNSNGFSIGPDASRGEINDSGIDYASWTFRKQEKFFDVVTYTGDGTANRNIAHSINGTVGAVFIKRTDASSNWSSACRLTNGDASFMMLNRTEAQKSSVASWFNNATFKVGTSDWPSSYGPPNYYGFDTNSTGATYVAYIFAHNAGGFGTSGTDNVISCGSFSCSPSGTAEVTLGYEPQWILAKDAANAGSWELFDNMRGMSYSSTEELVANTAGASYTYNPGVVIPTATGFTVTSSSPFGTSSNIIYIAIRRPMKPPTTGTSVFQPITTTSANEVLGTLEASDMGLFKDRTTVTNWFAVDRLRGIMSYYNPTLYTNLTNAEATPTTGDTVTSISSKNTGNGKIYFGGAGVAANYPLGYSFKRASGFFDVVCYTGNASSQTINHNLTVIPELVIFKIRSSTSSWWTTYSFASNYKRMALDLTNAESTISYGSVSEMTAAPTSTTLSLGNTGRVNGSGQTYVAYLFATVAGVSKVGTFTGTGTVTQTINAGFGASGARWVMIKRTDSTGNWYVFDTARGFTSSSSPYLLLNSTAAEVTGNNGCYAASTGFTLDTNASATVNINGASYIYLAIA